MNIKHLFLMITAALFAVACSSSDNGNGNGDDYAAIIATNYSGDIQLEVSGEVQSTAENKSLVLTRVEENVVKAVLTLNYGEGTSMAIETVEATASVTKNGDNYQLTSIENQYNNGTFDITSNMSGVITSSGEVRLVIEFTPGAMPMAITVTFSNNGSIELDYSNYIAGSYVGNMDLTVSGVLQGSSSNITLDITRTGVNEVQTVLALNYGEGTSMAIETVTTNATVSYENGNYELHSVETTTGTIVSNITSGVITADGEVAVVIEFTPGAMPMAITVTYSGAKAVAE